MMKRTLTACLIALTILVLLPVIVWAQETTLKTEIPSSHTLHIDITGNGMVIVDDIPYAQTSDIQIQRGAMPKIFVVSAGNTKIISIFLDEKDITEELRKGAYIMPEMCFDANLTVEFESVSETPETGDRVPLKALFFAMALSLIGVRCCLISPRKENT